MVERGLTRSLADARLLGAKHMETIIYYSRNAKKPPFKVTIEIDGQTAYINCDCPLGQEKKICRHKINAIRGEKSTRHQSTSDEAIRRLRYLFGPTSTLRQHLEEKWRALREYALENPDNEEEIGNKRKILGEAFANGFLNDNGSWYQDPFDFGEWEEAREPFIDGLNCPVTLRYISHEGIASTRDVIVHEVFVNNSRFYMMGYCKLREQKRIFCVDRIQGIHFGTECMAQEKSKLLDVVLQGKPK
ncbi:WYL domain-containing protein [Thiohalocapsa marina]|uniref:WYL domain-containing protein n=1 Tax=Thiohalocapsa marina TaxID=424902 RepID=A0A5M8F9L2_9GAMM|nr:WYL domain-containing protein [Thiohalocapsa marina]KAA6181513.1 WYL domain-containing protein [Thiohalocapsa marina]